MLLIIAIFVIIVVVVIIFIKRDNEEKEEEINKERKKIKSQFGSFTSQCLYDSYYDDGGIILANINEDKILIGKVTYKISNIEKCSTAFSNASSHTTYTEKQVISTDTGSAIGRAVVGGVIGGGVGAIIGGATASKEVKTVRTPHTTYSSDAYWVHVDIKGLSIRPLVRAKTREDGKAVCRFINDMISSLNKAKEEEQKKVIETSHVIDVNNFATGLTKEDLLNLDKGLNKILGKRFNMSDSFCLAWAEKIGLKLPVEINCTLKNDHLWMIYINYSSPNRTSLYADLMKSVNFLNDKYGKIESVNLDMTDIENDKTKEVGKWKTSNETVTLSIGQNVIGGQTIYSANLFMNANSSFAQLSAPKEFIKHDIDWQAITFGLAFNKIQEIDEYAEYHTETNVDLSNNYISSFSKSLGLTKLNRADVELYKDKLVQITVTSSHVALDELIGDIVLLKDYFEKKYGTVIEEHDVFDEKSWNNNILTYCEWNKGKDPLIEDKARIWIYKNPEGLYCYFASAEYHKIEEINH